MQGSSLSAGTNLRVKLLPETKLSSSQIVKSLSPRRFILGKNLYNKVTTTLPDTGLDVRKQEATHSIDIFRKILSSASSQTVDKPSNRDLLVSVGGICWVPFPGSDKAKRRDQKKQTGMRASQVKHQAGDNKEQRGVYLVWASIPEVHL